MTAQAQAAGAKPGDSQGKTHLLVLGERRAASWVLREQRMAFSADRVREVKKVKAGDRLFLYASGSCYGGTGGLFGHASVIRGVAYLAESFRINFREFAADLDLRVEGLTSFKNFQDLGLLAPSLHVFAGNPVKWGVYLRRPVVTLGLADTQLLEAALLAQCRPPAEVLSEYLAAAAR